MPTPTTSHLTDPTLTVRCPDAEVWRRALDLAGGDARRLEVLADLSVVVRNARVR